MVFVAMLGGVALPFLRGGFRANDFPQARCANLCKNLCKLWKTIDFCGFAPPFFAKFLAFYLNCLCITQFPVLY